MSISAHWFRVFGLGIAFDVFRQCRDLDYTKSRPVLEIRFYLLVVLININLPLLPYL